MATAEDRIELGRPYWRIDHQGDVEGFARPLLLAIRPVAHLIRHVAPGAVGLIVLCQLLTGLAVGGSLVILNRFLSILLAEGAGSASLTAAIPSAVLLLMLGAVRIGLDAAASLARATLAPRVRRAAEARLYAATLNVDLASFDDASFYDRLKRARDRGILHLEGAIVALIDALGALLATAGAVGALALIHPVLAPLLLLALAPGLWGALAAARIQYAAMDRSISLMRHAGLYGDLATQREAAPEVRANATASWVVDRFRAASGRLQDHMIGIASAEARMRAIAALLSGSGLALAFGLLGWMVHAGSISLAAAGAAVAAMRSAGGSLQQVILSCHQLLEKALYIGDLEDFMAAAEARGRGSGVLPKPPPPRSIAMVDVSFRYSGSDDWALRDISLTIRAGETLALAGENGSGKSTLAKLIGGLYPPTNGRIYWDGSDLAKLCPEGVSAHVAMVLQAPVRWPDTARVNVEMGRPEWRGDDQRLARSAQSAGATAMIDQLPGGWETLLSREFKGGRDLSAGQWQRLAIARGLYRDAPVVIWDEPTAPLDARGEMAAYESLQKLSAGRTVILITHRLTSIRNVDRIIFLKAGRVVEEGSHDELMSLDGEYARLFTLQAALHRTVTL